MDGQPPALAYGADAFRAQFGQGTGSFSGRFRNQPQQDAHSQNLNAAIMDAQTENFLDRLAEIKTAFEDKMNNLPFDFGNIPVVGKPDTVGPVRPQRQSGPGTLPGARSAQPNRAGAGLLGRHRVERPGADRGRRARGGREPTIGGREPRAPRRDPIEGFDPNASDPEDEHPNTTGHRGRGQTSMAEERVELNNRGSQGNDADAEEAPVVEDGRPGTERAPEMHSRAAQYVVTRTTPDGFDGTNLEAQDVESLAARTVRGYPEGTRFNVQITPVAARDDDAALDEIIKDRFPGSSV